MKRRPRITGKVLIAALARAGFVVVRTKARANCDVGLRYVVGGTLLLVRHDSPGVALRLKHERFFHAELLELTQDLSPESGAVVDLEKVNEKPNCRRPVPA